ncbi:hypothetical protein COP2_008960 [Malus domestica]
MRTGEKENERRVGAGSASAVVDTAERGCAGVEFWLIACSCCAHAVLSSMVLGGVLDRFVVRVPSALFE